MKRSDAGVAVPSVVKTLMAAEQYVSSRALEPALLELVKMRISQINGRVFCLDTRSGIASNGWESEKRLRLLDAWQEFPLYNERERAALEWAESLTNVLTSRATDDVSDRIRSQYDDEKHCNLTLAICQINSWNSIAIGLRYEASAVDRSIAV